MLGGVIASMLGQGMSGYDAARAAVYLHGKAGDLVVREKTQAGLIAGDLIEALPLAMRSVLPR